MKNQKGITLIALVITIIVLLILAGVAITMLSGKNGILTRAKQAQTDSSKGDLEEATKLAVAEIFLQEGNLGKFNPALMTVDAIVAQNQNLSGKVTMTQTGVAGESGAESTTPFKFSDGTSTVEVNYDTGAVKVVTE